MLRFVKVREYLKVSLDVQDLLIFKEMSKSFVDTVQDIVDTSQPNLSWCVFPPQQLRSL